MNTGNKKEIFVLTFNVFVTAVAYAYKTVQHKATNKYSLPIQFEEILAVPLA